MSEGRVSVEIKNGIGTVSFFHPKKNSLPGNVLRELRNAIAEAGNNDDARVIILASQGDGPFCAGASFDELLSIKNFEQGKEFFMGFARVILAMVQCPKFIVARVQGKTVGGGVGLVAAADYALALKSASLKLSELAVGIGPFVIGPAVERKIGKGPFQSMTIDTEWRSAEWAQSHALYSQTFESINELDSAIRDLAQSLSKSNPEAMKKLKSIFTEDAKNWSGVLEKRAEMSGKLVLSEFTSSYIQSFKNK
ncbi:MAG: enoyl-CoA hydratase [Desulfobacterales bacterium SG8_35_2]|nr:MAG: enoyl-CoA hydratase [Desulfobacterales bacterium SG8_35_2]